MNFKVDSIFKFGLSVLTNLASINFLIRRMPAALFTPLLSLRDFTNCQRPSLFNIPITLDCSNGISYSFCKSFQHFCS